MHEEQIDRIMIHVEEYGANFRDLSAESERAEIAYIRHDIEQLAAHPGVTQPWHMIEDGCGECLIVNTQGGYVYCRGMEEQRALELVRKLNGIED